MPRLSVIMPARNAAVHIRTALTSTLRALPPDAELVVLDDASDDDTEQILHAVPDSRLRVIRSESNLGVAESLNRLLDATDSQYVARMDADDVCFPWRFRVQRRQIANLDFSFTATLFLAESGRPVRPDLPGRFSTHATPLHLLLGNMLVHSTMFARRSMIADLGAYSPVPAEDYDLWLRAAAAGARIARSAVPCLGYRRHPGQLTASASWLDRRDRDPAAAASYLQLIESVLGIQSIDSVARAKRQDEGFLFQVVDQDFLEAGLRDKGARLPMIERGILSARRRRVLRPA